MGKKTEFNSERARQLVAQEAARLIVDQGMRDYRAAKIKAAEKLGLRGHGSLPGNAEIEAAVAQRTAEIEEFSYRTSHDLRSPLQAIATMAEFRRRDALEHLLCFSDDFRSNSVAGEKNNLCVHVSHFQALVIWVSRYGNCCGAGGPIEACSLQILRSCIPGNR